MAIRPPEIQQHIQKRGLLRAGERVGIAVSGGADSVALLRLLLDLREKLGIVLSVVHFNHKLRGRASDKDEQFVESLAEKFGLTLHVGRGDVAKKAKIEKANVEDTARRARYAFFRKLTEGGAVDCVATAHTADDQAETVLAHILRGTGLAGLGGIHPTTKDRIVRPLLAMRRSDLRKYLKSKKQKWREDATNRDTTKQRARMRKKLLPLLEKSFNPKSVEHLADLAHAAQEDEALIAGFFEIYAATKLKAENGRIRIGAHDVKQPFPLPVGEAANHALGKRLVRKAFGALSQKTGQLTLRQVEQVMELAKTGENGKLLQLPGGVDVRRDDDWLFFVRRDSRGKKQSNEFSYNVRLDSGRASIALKEIGCVIRIRSIDWPNAGGETIDTGEAALDRQKLRGKLILRSLRPGDRMRPQGHQKAHKLKRLLNEKRVSRWDREGWPVLEFNNNIVWARGFTSADFAATAQTKQAIVISEEPA